MYFNFLFLTLDTLFSARRRSFCLCYASKLFYWKERITKTLYIRINCKTAALNSVMNNEAKKRADEWKNSVLVSTASLLFHVKVLNWTLFSWLEYWLSRWPSMEYKQKQQQLRTKFSGYPSPQIYYLFLIAKNENLYAYVSKFKARQLT